MSDLIPGPCVLCGATNYQLSMGGPTICPWCDCGPSPKAWRAQVDSWKILANAANKRADDACDQLCGLTLLLDCPAEQLLDRARTLRDAAVALHNKIHAAEPFLISQAFFCQNHGFEYTGPTWVGEMKALEAALEPHR